MAIFKIKDGFSIVDSNNVESQQISGIATAISNNPSDSNILTEKAVADAIASGGGGGNGGQVYEPQNPGYTDTPTYDGSHAYSVNTCGAMLPATIKSFTFWPYSLNPYAVSGFKLWVAIYDIDDDFNLLSSFTWDDSKHPATDWAYWPRTFDFDSPITISRDGRYRVVIYIYAPGASGQVVMTIGNGSNSTFPPFQKYTMPTVSGGYASAPTWTGNYSSASGQVRIPWFQLNPESTSGGGSEGSSYWCPAFLGDNMDVISDGGTVYTYSAGGCQLPDVVRSFSCRPAFNPYSTTNFRLWVAIYTFSGDLLSSFTWDASKHPSTNWQYKFGTFNFDAPIVLDKTETYNIAFYVYGSAATQKWYSTDQIVHAGAGWATRSWSGTHSDYGATPPALWSSFTNTAVIAQAPYFQLNSFSA